jgi:hypothetical protein
LAALAGGQAWAAISIASCKFIISAPGNYVVTADLTCNGDDGIDINASNVSVNLNGHLITSVSGVNSGLGIAVETPPRKPPPEPCGHFRSWLDPGLPGRHSHRGL